MHSDDTTFEHTLAQSRPGGLDGRLLDRLTAAMDLASAPVDDADAKTEEMLAAHRPVALPEFLMARFERLHDASPKVVAMPKSGRIIPFRRYVAAAAIALVGAAAALLAPMDGGRPVVAGGDDSTAPAPAADARHFVPAAHARGLSEARHEGVIWKDNTPHRVLRIVYTDTITLRNDAGEVVEVEQPRVEYIVVPETTD